MCSSCCAAQALGSYLAVKGSDPQNAASPLFVMRDSGQQLARVPGVCSRTYVASCLRLLRQSEHVREQL